MAQLLVAKHAASAVCQGVLRAKCRLAVVLGYSPSRWFWLSRWLGILWTVNACVAVDALFCLKQLRGCCGAGD